MSSSSSSVLNNNNNRLELNEDPFSFQDFISTIINENDIEWHKLVQQDLEKILQLKFREFKKLYLQKQNILIPEELFSKIAFAILKEACEEPNGILGARINLKLIYDGKLIEVARFAYDPCTLTTFEVFITIKEDVRSLKKFLHAFKLYSNFGKFISTYLDENNYEFTKRKLY